MLIIVLGKLCISIYKYQCAGKHSTASFLGRRHPGLRYLITVGVNTTTTANFKPRMCGASSRDMGKKLTMDPPPAGPNWRWHPALCKLLSEFVTFYKLNSKDYCATFIKQLPFDHLSKLLRDCTGINPATHWKGRGKITHFHIPLRYSGTAEPSPPRLLSAASRAASLSVPTADTTLQRTS